MDFPLSSSVILMVAVALWIVWVAPYVLRNRRQQLQPVADFADYAMDENSEEPQAGMVLKLADQQEKPMDTSYSRAPVAARLTDNSGAPRTKPASMPASASGTLRIRYGRLAIALAGVAMIFAAAVTGVLRLFGAGSAWLPAASLLLGILAIGLLRRLAVRDRRAKVSAAFRAAMAPSAPAEGPGERLPGAAVTHSARQRETRIFDAEAGKATAPQPLSAFELRQAALAVAEAAGDTAVGAPKQATASLGGEWKPVDVPKPVYVDAAKAERPAPEPLDLPEAPKPVGKPTLKQNASPVFAPASGAPNVASAAGVTSAAGATSPAGATSSGGATSPAGATSSGGATSSAGKGQSALSNLDDVLQRRRA